MADSILPRKAADRECGRPYRKLTQVGRESIPRRVRELSRRNSQINTVTSEEGVLGVVIP